MPWVASWAFSSEEVQSDFFRQRLINREKLLFLDKSKSKKLLLLAS